MTNVQLISLDLGKAEETITLALEKADIDVRRCSQVSIYLDESASMSSYLGLVDPIMKLVLVLADKLDVDGALNFYTFDSNLHKHGDLTIRDYNKKFSITPNTSTALHKCILNEYDQDQEPETNTGGLFGFVKKLFTSNRPKKVVAETQKTKQVAIIITDGEPDSIIKVREAIDNAPSHVFYQIVGIGNVNMLNGYNNKNAESIVITDILNIDNAEFLRRIMSTKLASFLSNS